MLHTLQFLEEQITGKIFAQHAQDSRHEIQIIKTERKIQIWIQYRYRYRYQEGKKESKERKEKGIFLTASERAADKDKEDTGSSQSFNRTYNSIRVLIHYSESI